MAYIAMCADCKWSYCFCIVDIAREIEDELRDLGHNIIFDYSESYNTPNDFVDEAIRQINLKSND